MKIFETLPTDARRALARKELTRRGVLIDPQESGEWVRGYFTADELARMDELGEQYADLYADELPAEVRDEWRSVFGRLVTASRAHDAKQLDPRSDIQRDADLLTLVQRAEASNAERNKRRADRGLEVRR